MEDMEKEIFEEAGNPKADSGFGEEVPKEEKKPEAAKEQKKSKAKVKELEAALEAEKAKTAEAEDKYLRLAAEYENFRKRSKAEREGIYAEACADAIKELLPVFDNLERATQYTAPDKVCEGVEIILKGLPDVFAKMKITVYGKAGEQFDPNIHNAVMHIEDEAYGENEIVDVFQQGYMLGDKVVRYAMVRVAN
ncbi:MAG: nucleotide exchange factor GrpE [Ruminococcaceae bacterium]|nr:nucleotide exchange factor GrpE [Oscillospiraceae bacterium]